MTKTMTRKFLSKIANFTIFASILLMPMLILYKMDRLEHRLSEPKIIFYKTDNEGAAMVGKVIGKEIIEGHHTIEIGAYGKFLVTEDQYNEINIGDEAPDYLKQRGS